MQQKQCLNDPNLKPGEVQTDVLVAAIEVTACSHGWFSVVSNMPSCVYLCWINAYGLFPKRLQGLLRSLMSARHTRTQQPCAPDSAGFGDPRRDRGMLSVSELPLQRPWERDPGKIVLDSKHPVCHPCVGVCTQTLDVFVTVWVRGWIAASVDVYLSLSVCLLLLPCA